jgi:hypothetical protein
MLLLRFILLPTLLFATKANGQQHGVPSNLVGKTFVSRTLEYLEILNDTTLYSSINSYTDTAKLFLQNDTLFIKQRYLQTDQAGTKWMDRLYDYKVITLSDDTLRLKNNFRFNYKSANLEDTLFFINIEKLKEPVTDFKFLRLDFSSPWSGTKQITIDSLGNVTFIDSPILYSINNPSADKNAKPKSIKGRLTQKEFLNFKNLLSKSLISRLPFKRGCPMDGATSNFQILIGAKKINSTGCNLSWTHAFLLNYLYDVDQNQGLRKAK